MSRQREFRICKTFLEQAQIKKACQLTKQLWDWLCLQPLLGQTELEVRGILIAEAMRLGLEEEAFSTIVASGVQSSIPHHTSSDLLITPGPLLVDM
ncbi:MAG: M24 family metallopeptidase [bacterium]|nr:M24 family metallopeptidase [bacterium]